MKVILSTLAIILISIITYISLPKYRSAFEADQACHFEMTIYQNKEEMETACDHDIETNQWLMYQTKPGITPAKVIKRYSY